jgi:hypothetical protein
VTLQAVYTERKDRSINQYAEGWVGPRVGLDMAVKRKVPAPPMNRKYSQSFYRLSQLGPAD